ncbi:hypothetical protein [Chitinibacter tainanensis]|uniref:hypothetical protein n=1 Tax=Chitinibacter tainanensis TaxID=230667 RepID=UPI0003F941E5|nr:hypothetical protein [Chitinibacter tainanensis]
MFAVLRLLLVIALVVITYAGVRYSRDRQPHWLRLIRVVLYLLLSLTVLAGIGLFIERLSLS